MISAKDWWANLAHYNSTLYPLQLIVMGIAIILLICLYYKPGKRSSVFIQAYLSITNLWSGLVFFIILGKNLPSPLRFIQGGLFITIGICFAIDICIGRTQLSFPKSSANKTMTLLLLILVFSYPLFGLLQGHSYNQLIYPGTVPCATTALSLVILAASLPKASKALYILLLLWAIPFAPLIQIPQFKVYEDAIMFIIGIYSLCALIFSIIKQKRH